MTEKTKKIMKFGAIGLCAAVLMSAAVIAVPRAERALPLEAAPVLQVVPDASAEGSGVSLVSAQISPSTYEDYGIMPTALGAQVITATVKSNGVSILSDLDWSSAWVNASSEWATEKTVTDYIRITPLAESGSGNRKVTVECLKAFGEQIVITCAVRGDAEEKATVSVHYLQSLQNTVIKFGETACVFNGNALTEFDFTATSFQGLALQGKPTYLKYSVECSTPYTIPLEVTCVIDTEGCEPFSHSLSDEKPTDSGTVKGVFCSSSAGAAYDWTSFNLIERGMPYSMQFLTENLYRYRFGRGTSPEYTRYTVSQLLSDYSAYGTDASNRKLFNVTFTFSCPQALSAPVTKKTTFCIGKFVDINADSVSVDITDLYF